MQNSKANSSRNDDSIQYVYLSVLDSDHDSASYGTVDQLSISSESETTFWHSEKLEINKSSEPYGNQLGLAPTHWKLSG